MKWIAMVAAAVLAAAAGPASAALFVSGDSNIFQPYLAGGQATAANQRFLQNIIEGSNVLIRSSVVGVTQAQQTVDYLNGQGYAASLLGGFTTLSADALADKDLVVLYGLNVAATSGETAALADFLDAGGNLMIVGENGTYFDWMNDLANALLTGLGSSMQLSNKSIAFGVTEVATVLDANAYTAGADGLNYIFTSTVQGGVGLFGTQNEGEAFVAYEPTGYVPEPAAWALMIAGFGLAGAALRRHSAMA